MKYLLDTSFVVDLLRRRAGTKDKLAELLPGGVAVSWATVAELYEGAYLSARADDNLAMVEELLADVYVLFPDVQTAMVFGEAAARLARAGRKIPDMDLIIAATATRHDLTLVTSDVRHFRDVAGLAVLHVGDAAET